MLSPHINQLQTELRNDYIAIPIDSKQEDPFNLGQERRRALDNLAQTQNDRQSTCVDTGDNGASKLGVKLGSSILIFGLFMACLVPRDQSGPVIGGLFIGMGFLITVFSCLQFRSNRRYWGVRDEIEKQVTGSYDSLNFFSKTIDQRFPSRQRLLTPDEDKYPSEVERKESRMAL